MVLASLKIKETEEQLVRERERGYYRFLSFVLTFFYINRMPFNESARDFSQISLTVYIECPDYVVCTPTFCLYIL